MNTMTADLRRFGRDVRYMRPDPRRPLPRRRTRGWRRLRRLCVRLLLTAAVTLGTVAAAREAARSSTFALKHVEVSGCTHASPAALEALVRKAPTRSLFELDLSQVRALLETHPWVLRAEVSRRLPDTITLAVTERTPAGVALVRGHAVLVDAEGALLSECGTVAWDCDRTVLTGLDGLSGDVLRRRLRTGLKVLDTVRALAPGLASRISEADLSREDRVALVPRDGGAPLLLSPDRPALNIGNYLKAREEIDGRCGRQKYVDLRFDGRIAVMPDEEEEGGREAGGDPRGARIGR